MTDPRNPDTRRRLLEAAAELIAAQPGKDVPLRTICAKVGVQLPTLYHFFGNKDGLLNAVVEHGFDLYMSLKEAKESSGDPIQDIRDGWDAHVRFGLENPGFYALMYGQVAPGSRPAGQDRPALALMRLTELAERHGRLVVPAGQAAVHILATNIGVTLRQITSKTPDPALTTNAREATIAAITGTTAAPGRGDIAAAAATALLSALPPENPALGAAETALLRQWLALIAKNQC
ncbi:TetR/AcrR family transcriptional regulator [Paenarthrobacter nicotinovorans]|uniref:TetR/AcrR family transcriptional regulator n=1 Tax=Paenarthrobacter nicotinovorans TaxID=29320 RepID=A0ABV0GLR9_PAENI